MSKNKEKLPPIGSLFKCSIDGQIAILIKIYAAKNILDEDEGVLVAVTAGRDESLGKRFIKRFLPSSNWKIVEGKRR